MYIHPDARELFGHPPLSADEKEAAPQEGAASPAEESPDAAEKPPRYGIVF